MSERYLTKYVSDALVIIGGVPIGDLPIDYGWDDEGVNLLTMKTVYQGINLTKSFEYDDNGNMIYSSQWLPSDITSNFILGENSNFIMGENGDFIMGEGIPAFNT